MQKVGTESRPLLFKKSNKLLHRMLGPTEKKSSIPWLLPCDSSLTLCGGFNGRLKTKS